MKQLFFLIALTMFFIAHSFLVAAADVSKDAILSGSAITGNYTSYSVSFGSNYSSIDSVCFDFTFNNDLLDPKEEISYSVVPAPTSYWYGKINIESLSQSTATSCITPAHTGFSEFLDGTVAGSIWMKNGTVSVQTLNIRLVNAVIAAPPSAPIPSCSLSANPSLGTGPFSSIITVSYSNLSTAPNTITINCNASNTTTATGCTGTTGSCSATCSYPAVASSMTYTISASVSGTACPTATVSNNPAPTPIPSDTTSPTVGTLSPTSITPNKQVAFSATVSDNVGIKDCKLVKNGTNYTATVSSGTAGYTFVSGLPEGNYNMYFECTDAAGNTGKSTALTVLSGKQPLQVSISLPKTTYYPNENLEPKVTITDASGKLITDASISSNITGPKTLYPYFFYSILCDCYKAFQWLSESTLAGDYTLYIVVSHSDFTKTTASATFKIVKPIISTFTITTDKSEYSPGDSIKATITAKDSFGNAIKDVYITGEIRDATTGKLVGPIYPYMSGDVYIYTYSLGSESLGKSYKISISTTWKEQKATAEATVTVEKRGLNGDVVLEKTVLGPKDSLRGRIKVYDKDGKTMSDVKVGINVIDPQGNYAKSLDAIYQDGFYEIKEWKVEDWTSVGSYTLEIKVSKYPEDIIIKRQIEITKEKLNVEVFLDKTSYKPNDRMYIKILVTYPNGTIANDAKVNGEIFPLTSEPFIKESAATGSATTAVAAKEKFYQPSACRIYPSPIPPVYYKGEFIQKYFIDSPYISTDCPTGKYVLKLKVYAPGYAETEVTTEFNVALGKLFIETGFSLNGQFDSVNLAIYADVKNDDGKLVEFVTVEGILRPPEEDFKGCIKRFTLHYDDFLKRYIGNEFVSRYECATGNYIIQLRASSPSYETAEVVQGFIMQYKQGQEYRAYVPATPTESSCREVSCGLNCVQKICLSEAPPQECFNIVTNRDCVETCKKEFETAISTNVSKPADFETCFSSCANKVPCQGAAVPTVPIEAMVQKLNELRKEVAETKTEVNELKQILLFIIDFVNSILSKYLGQQEAITVPSQVVANATNTTSPISGAFSAIIKSLLRQ